MKPGLSVLLAQVNLLGLSYKQAAQRLETAAPSLAYSDQVPTVPGWYWERRSNGVRLLELNKHSRPRSWRGSKARLLATLKEMKTDPEAIAATAKLPATFWRIEYAGPILPPT